MRPLFALIVLLAAPWAQMRRPLHRASPPAAQYAVIIVLDGAKARYLTEQNMPNISWLLHHGTNYSRAIVGQEIANTPPSHATIGTGVFPKHHGIEGFWWEDPLTHTLTRPTDNNEVENGALEQVLHRHHVPSIAASVKQRYPHGTVISVTAHKCYAADAMGTPAADYILCAQIYHDRWVAQAVHGHEPPPGAVGDPRFDVPIPPPTLSEASAVQQWKLTDENHWTMRYALWAFHAAHIPRLLMINLPETDVMGHFTGANPTTMQIIMRGVDSDIGKLLAAYRRAGILSRTVFVLTADHGMNTVQQRLPFEVLDKAIALTGATKIYLEADTAAAIGIAQPNKARAVARNVALLGGPAIDATYYRVHLGSGWVYRAAYLRADLSATLRAAYARLVATDASADGPDVLALYAPHWTTGDRPVRTYHWLAGHLGAQWADQHIPFVVAGAGVLHNRTSTVPARLVDIAPTVERLLGTHVAGDGVVLANALRNPRHLDAVRQRALDRVLAPQVQAVAQRSSTQ